MGNPISVANGPKPESGSHPVDEAGGHAVDNVNCHYCKHKIGETDGFFLYIGLAIFPLVVTFRCSNCGYTNTWRPLNPSRGKLALK